MTNFKPKLLLAHRGLKAHSVLRLFGFYVVLSFSVTPAVNVHSLYSLNMIHKLQTGVFLGTLFVVLLL
jgi:hypothetical protein